MLINKLFKLFAPPDTTLETGGDLSINDMIDEMGKEEEVPDPDNKDEKKEVDLLTNDEPPVDKKDDENEEKIELEDEEDKEPEVDDLEPIENISRKEILKLYPDIFKKFPQLETAYYRERKYSELLPTIEDAKEAVTKSQEYDKISSEVLNGNIDTVLAGVKSSDPKAFNKLVDNYLPMLGKADQQAYFHVLGNVIKNTIVGMVTEANSSENEDLKAAAVILHQFMFGKSDFKKAEPFGPHKESNEETELSKEKQQFAQQKFESALEGLAVTNTNIIKSTISHHMDPKGVMTDYVKKTAIKEALEEVESAMNQNTRFKATMDKLWEQVFKTNYSKAALDNVKRAHLNQAKTLLRPIILKHKNAALKGMGKRVTDEREEVTKKGPVSVGRNAPANNRGKETAVPKGMSTLDFLNSE